MGKMYFPGERPDMKDKTQIMDKETWIKSRTNNPDRLGRDVWESAYDLAMTGGLPRQKFPKELQKQMVADYLEKNGLVLQDESKWESVELWNFSKTQAQGDELLTNKESSLFAKRQSSTLRNRLKNANINSAVVHQTGKAIGD